MLQIFRNFPDFFEICQIFRNSGSDFGLGTVDSIVVELVELGDNIGVCFGGSYKYKFFHAK